MLSLEGEVYKPQNALGNTVDHAVALSQLNGYFVSRHYLVILADIVLVFAYTGIFMQGDIHLKFLGCLLPFLTVSIINIL